TLSEIFGERTVPLDEWSRTMGLAPLSDRLLAALPMESRRLLESYSAGVNAWLLCDPPPPLECALLQYRVQPWQPRESLAVLRLFGWLLSMGWHIDPVLGEIAEKVGGEKMQRLFGGLLPAVDPAAAQALAGLAPLLHEYLGFVPNGVGSNGWAVSGFRSRSSAALLANDTHLPFITPSVFYLLHLTSPGFQAVGASFPGLPGIVVGRNRNIAWGVTHGMIDDFDFYQLAADSLNPEKFIYNGQALEYGLREERVSVKGAKERRIRIRSTPWGPVMPVTAFAQRPLAMQWSGFTLSDEWTAFLKIMTAANWHEFRTALSTCKTPGEHFIFADRSGHIGSQLAAAVPQRSFTGSFAPAPDSLAQRRWLNDVPFTSLPSQSDPLCGYVVHANQRLGDRSDPLSVCGYWEPPYRYQRIVDRLDSLPRLSLNDMKTLQNDLYNGHAAWLVPQVIASLSGYSAQPDSPELLAKELLHGWDYQQTQESIAALIYEMIYLEVFRNTFADELGKDLLDRFLALPHVNVALMDGLIARADSSWFDNVLTPEVETGREVLAKSFFTAIDSLKKQRGDNLGDWSWGAVHTLSGFHPFA
ncbi:MAG TPA: penicillin acylase family protein, partial [bacterium]|nr:penicillin acylase family protein [bacterium]